MHYVIANSFTCQLKTVRWLNFLISSGVNENAYFTLFHYIVIDIKMTVQNNLVSIILKLFICVKHMICCKEKYLMYL